MKAAGRILIVIALLCTASGNAFPQYRPYRPDPKMFAYRAGYEAGYRDGQRQGAADFRFRQRFNYRTWDYNHPDRYYRPELRFKGDYKKGYKEGYRAGYE